MIIRVAISILFLVLIASCKSDEDRFVSEIETAIRSAAKSESAILHIKDITFFEWDQLFVFGPYTPVEYIEKALGRKIPQVRKSGIERAESFCILIFLSNNTIVKYFELNRSNGDFSLLSSLSPYTVSSASFSITTDGPMWVIDRNINKNL